MSTSVCLSIIIPVFNGEDCIEECLSSILSQVFKDYEIIIKDGLSTDRTLDIIRKLNNKKIKIVSSSDSGIYDAMNQGIEYSSGNWIIFMGSDDSFTSPDVLRKIFDGASILGDVELIYGGGITKGVNLINSFNWRMLKGNSLNHQCIFYKRTIFNRLMYDISYKLAADYKLNLILYVNRVKSLKRKNIIISNFGSGGASSLNKPQGFLEECLVRKEVLGSIFGSILNSILYLKFKLLFLFVK